MDQLKFVDFNTGYLQTTDGSIYKLKFDRIDTEVDAKSKCCNSCKKLFPPNKFVGKSKKDTSECHICLEKRRIRSELQRNKADKEREKVKFNKDKAKVIKEYNLDNIAFDKKMKKPKDKKKNPV